MSYNTAAIKIAAVLLFYERCIKYDFAAADRRNYRKK